MSNPYEPLVAASVRADAGGMLRSTVYGDIYHSGSGAFGQAEHVFLRGNELPRRWRARRSFTVCETGFGLGRNFLALWDAWRADPGRCGRLHVVSFEAHPFPRADLARILLPGLPPRLRALGEALARAWPPLLPGLHRLEFESGALTLTLAFGPVARLARQVEASVDAYFLDGFAPDRNPEMWTPGLFGQLVRMANRNATAASWCCASRVRKTLSDAGFIVAKAPGFGRKREMMTAVLRPALGRAAADQAGASAIVVGGGIAGAGMARGLACRGHRVAVLDPVFRFGRGANQRGHLAAAFTPLIARDDNFRARLARAGVACAARRWGRLAAAPARCGTLDLALTDERAERARATLERLAFPADWVRWVDRGQASALAGFTVPAGGVFFADGHLARPEPLIDALLDDERISCRAVGVADIGRDEEGGWIARDARGRVLARAAVLVLANASRAGSLMGGSRGLAVPARIASIEDVGGQVSYFASGPLGLNATANIAGDGYWLPAVDGLAAAGGTYGMPAPNGAVGVTPEGHFEIARKASGMLGVGPERLLAHLGSTPGWAGRRAVASGRLPVIGQAPGARGLWVACGYGSRGLTWSALAGEIVAAHLDNEPAPLERELLRAISPS